MSFNLAQIVNKQLSVKTDNAIQKKQPNGFLSGWKPLTPSSVAQHSMYVGYDNNLYYTMDGKEYKQSDLLDENTITVGRTVTDHPKFSVRFPDKFIQVYNVNDGENLSIEIRKKVNFEDTPMTVHTISGRNTNRLACSSHYDGVNAYVFVGEYDAVRNVPAKVWFSKDGGETFNSIFQSPVNDPNNSAHCHIAFFDPFQCRIWASFGDGLNRAVWYSDNFGTTFTKVDNNIYQPTMMVAFANKMFFGRDSQDSKSGLWGYTRPHKLSEFKPITEFEDALTFINVNSPQYYPSGNYAQKGNEAYIAFPSMIAEPNNFIFATGDGGESWHCVYSGDKAFDDIMYKDGYVIGGSRAWGSHKLYFVKTLDWVY